MLEFLRKAIPWFFAALLFASGWYMGSNAKDADWKEVVHNEYVTRVEANRATQKQLYAISEKYQGDIAGLEGSTDRVIADLRSDNKRLRVKVSTTGTPSSDGRCVFDGKAELDETDAKRIIRVTQQGDAWIEALQETIRKLQGGK